MRAARVGSIVMRAASQQRQPSQAPSSLPTTFGRRSRIPTVTLRALSSAGAAGRPAGQARQCSSQPWGSRGGRAFASARFRKSADATSGRSVKGAAAGGASEGRRSVGRWASERRPADRPDRRAHHHQRRLILSWFGARGVGGESWLKPACLLAGWPGCLRRRRAAAAHAGRTGGRSGSAVGFETTGGRPAESVD